MPGSPLEEQGAAFRNGMPRLNLRDKLKAVGYRAFDILGRVEGAMEQQHPIAISPWPVNAEGVERLFHKLMALRYLKNRKFGSGCTPARNPERTTLRRSSLFFQKI